MSTQKVFSAIYDSPLGLFTIISDNDSILEIKFPEQQSDINQATDRGNTDLPAVLVNTLIWLDDYFNEKNPALDSIKLNPKGNAFRQCVWKYLNEIPYGATSTYGEIAAKVAKDLGKEKMSAQAVGQAIESNPIPVIIPCHRVIGKNGKLTGYAGGLEIKEWLLHHEHADIMEHDFFKKEKKCWKT